MVLRRRKNKIATASSPRPPVAGNSAAHEAVNRMRLRYHYTNYWRQQWTSPTLNYLSMTAQHRSTTKTGRDAMTIREIMTDPERAPLFLVKIGMIALGVAVAVTVGWILLL